MTSTHSSSQKFDKLEWIQQKIEEIREECGTANSGEAGDKQYAVWPCCIATHRTASAW